MSRERDPKKDCQKCSDAQAPAGVGMDAVRVMPCEPQTELEKRLCKHEEVGEGGMSVIERVFDTNLLRSVARKSVKKGLVEDEAARGQLVEEAQLTAQLDHPHIVPVHELGIDGDGKLFFTMKLVRGRTFKEMLHEVECAERNERDLFEQLQVFLKVCDAVAFAHSRGVIHRDLKPANIMVGEFGEVYLMDWGLAKLKQRWRPSQRDREMPTFDERTRYVLPDEDGMVRATLAYMAPEQARGDTEATDERTDVFCLGGILYEILTGRPPYVEDSVQRIVFKALEGRVDPPIELVDFDVPARLSQISMHALERIPDERYQTVREFKREVESFLQSGWQFQRQVFPAGSLIVREGEPGDEAYIITGGRCTVYKTVEGKRIILEEIGVGDVFGEIAVFAKQPRGASVEAIEQVSVMVVSGKHFEEDLGMSFWLGLFVKALAERLLEMDGRLIELERERKDR